ncbi:hypothetical protein FA13DRAFT_1735020, partial [Coprinellus micaceus]
MGLGSSGRGFSFFFLGGPLSDAFVIVSHPDVSTVCHSSKWDCNPLARGGATRLV